MASALMASALVSVAIGMFVGSTLMYSWERSQRNDIIFMKTRHTSTHKIYLVLIQSIKNLA